MKRKNVSNELVGAMEEMLAVVQGRVKPARVTKFKPAIALEIRQIRIATGLSRAEFARRYALDPRALQEVGAGAPPSRPRGARVSHSDRAQTEGGGRGAGELRERTVRMIGPSR